ncbi:hypothetical protein D3C80_1990000 [compost metagenome]
MVNAVSAAWPRRVRIALLTGAFDRGWNTTQLALRQDHHNRDERRNPGNEAAIMVNEMLIGG